MRAARYMSNADIKTEIDALSRRFTKMRQALDEEGGMSGSPGEWMIERMNELDTELLRRKQEG